MPILLKRRNGEITLFRNAEFIPHSILDRCGSELNSIPRNPKKLLQSWDSIAMAVNEFLTSLSETMRMEGITLEKIAEKLGYKTHSAVHKRIRKIGLAYEKFSGGDFGFSQKKII